MRRGSGGPGVAVMPVDLRAVVVDVDAVERDPVLGDVGGARLRDGDDPRAAIEPAQRKRLQEEGGRAADGPQLAPVVLAVDVMDERDPGDAQPQRRQEGDAVDDLEHHVGVGHEVAGLAPDDVREDRDSHAHPVDGEPALLLVGDRARIARGEDRDGMAPVEPPDHLGIEVGAGASSLRVRPVPVGQDQDVQPLVRARPVGQRRPPAGLHRGLVVSDVELSMRSARAPRPCAEEPLTPRTTGASSAVLCPGAPAGPPGRCAAKRKFRRWRADRGGRPRRAGPRQPDRPVPRPRRSRPG